MDYELQSLVKKKDLITFPETHLLVILIQKYKTFNDELFPLKSHFVLFQLNNILYTHYSYINTCYPISNRIFFYISPISLVESNSFQTMSDLRKIIDNGQSDDFTR